MDLVGIRILLECGRYGELIRALTGRSPREMSTADITDVLTDSMEEHPDLQSLLVDARVLLVQHPAVYSRAARARVRVFDHGERLYGPFFFDMFARPDIWRHLVERAHESEESPVHFAASQWRHFEERISELPILELVRPPVSDTVEATASTLDGSTLDIGFLIPPGFRSGWLLRSSAPVQGRIHYVRGMHDPQSGDAFTTLAEGLDISMEAARAFLLWLGSTNPEEAAVGLGDIMSIPVEEARHIVQMLFQSGLVAVSKVQGLQQVVQELLAHGVVPGSYEIEDLRLTLSIGLELLLDGDDDGNLYAETCAAAWELVALLRSRGRITHDQFSDYANRLQMLEGIDIS